MAQETLPGAACCPRLCGAGGELADTVSSYLLGSHSALHHHPECMVCSPRPYACHMRHPPADSQVASGSHLVCFGLEAANLLSRGWAYRQLGCLWSERDRALASCLSKRASAMCFCRFSKC